MFIPDNDFLPRSHILLHHIDIPYEIITCAVKHPRQQHQPLQARQTSAIFKTCTIGAIRKNLFTDIKENSNAYIEQKNLMYKDILDKKMVERWSRIKDIMERKRIQDGAKEYQGHMSITSAFGVCDVPMALAGFPSTDYAAHTVVTHLFDYVNAIKNKCTNKADINLIIGKISIWNTTFFTR